VKKRDEFPFWSTKLWSVVPIDGVRKKSSLKQEKYGYVSDLVWFRVGPGFSKDEGLEVTTRMLNTNNPPNVGTGIRQVFFPFIDTTAIASHIWLLRPGCWEITGQYVQERLSFTVWIN
jgi:hypothetical protein